MTNHKKYVLFYSLKEMEEKFYKDIDGRFWELEQDRDNYDDEEKYELSYRINDNGSLCLDRALCDEIREAYLDNGGLSWAIKERITEEDNPEYFL